MALYAIGDLHLCLGAPKPMDVFGGNWVGYMEKLRDGLSVIGPDDTLISCSEQSARCSQVSISFLNSPSLIRCPVQSILLRLLFIFSIT